MAIQMTITKHAVAYPSKVLAANYGAHMFSVLLTEDVDNGWFVGKGTWKDLDLYEETAPTATNFEAVVRAKAANGNYYVEVTKANPGEALFVYQVPMIEEEYTNEFKKLENFVNANGDVVRTYDLCVGDIVELSTAAFSAAPTVGATVTLQAISGKSAMQLG